MERYGTLGKGKAMHTRINHARLKKILIWIPIAILAVCFACVLPGMWNTSVGYEGVVNFQLQYVGFCLLGVSFVGFTALLIWQTVYRLSHDEYSPSQTLVIFFKDIGALALNIGVVGLLAYVALIGIVGLAMGDSTRGTLVVLAFLALVVLGIGGIVAFLVWRKKHPHSLQRVFRLFSILVMFVLAICCFAFGIYGIGQAATDLSNGPTTALCTSVSDVDVNRPSRSKGLAPATVDISFATMDEKKTNVRISQQDSAAYDEIVDASYPAYVMYYPETDVFVSVASVSSESPADAGGSTSGTR